MSNISTAFDAIKAKMQTLFTEVNGYYQLANPYDVEENTTPMHEKGWGVALGAGANTNRELSCRLSVQRSISIILTRRRYANELDITPKEDAEKAILEDQYNLIKAMENEFALNNNVSGVTRCVFASDGGIESVLAESDAFIKLVSVFELEYFENLQP